jgi:iron-sulfur cluster repair protein YtfE (RIC family)
MNAIDLLKADHERVKALLTQLSESTERGVKKRTELLAKLEAEISLHTKLEEEILYPAFRKAGGKEQDIMYHEAKEEHRTFDHRVFRPRQSGQGIAGAPHRRRGNRDVPAG